MIKSLLMLTSLFVYFVFGLFFADAVKISTNHPQEVKPGDEFTYEITIEKPGVMGFAKVQQDLPEGFTAEVIEAKSATFSAIAGKVKFIWMALPSDDQFTISYKVKVDANALPGDKQILGKFSYLVDNVKESKDIPSLTIKVAGDVLAASSTAPAATNTESSTVNEAIGAVSTSPESSPVETQVSALNESGTASDKVVIKRRIEAMSEPGKYKVIYDITNNGLTGFAKLQDILPGEMMGYEQDSKSAVYSCTNKKSKFVWMSFPEDKQFEVSYMAVTTNPAEFSSIAGEFSYLDNNETKRLVLEGGTNLGETTNLAQNSASTPNTPVETLAVAPSTTPTTAVSKTEIPATAPVEKPSTTSAGTEKPTNTKSTPVTEAKIPEPLASTSKSNTSSTPSQNMSNIAANNTGLGYKVQIMAGKKNIKDVPEYFKKTYSYTETAVAIENHQGWIKYTIDWYDSYKSARDRRNQVSAGYKFPGPFVTAYNNGKRITVQEALMISKEKWMP